MDTVTENITLISKLMKNMNKNLPGKPRPLMRRLSSLQEMVRVTKRIIRDFQQLYCNIFLQI